MTQVSVTEPDYFSKKPTQEENEKPQDKTTEQKDVLRQFTEDIDILGLKFLCRPGIHVIRKGMYLLLVLFGIGFAIYQIEDQVISVHLHRLIQLRNILSAMT